MRNADAPFERQTAKVARGIPASPHVPCRMPSQFRRSRATRDGKTHGSHGPRSHVQLRNPLRTHRLPHKTELFSTAPDGRLTVEMDILVNAELEARIQKYGSKVEVMNPPELRENFAKYARENWEQYRG